MTCHYPISKYKTTIHIANHWRLVLGPRLEPKSMLNWVRRLLVRLTVRETLCNSVKVSTMIAIHVCTTESCIRISRRDQNMAPNQSSSIFDAEKMMSHFESGIQILALSLTVFNCLFTLFCGFNKPKSGPTRIVIIYVLISLPKKNM